MNRNTSNRKVKSPYSGELGRGGYVGDDSPSNSSVCIKILSLVHLYEEQGPIEHDGVSDKFVKICVTIGRTGNGIMKITYLMTRDPSTEKIAGWDLNGWEYTSGVRTITVSSLQNSITGTSDFIRNLNKLVLDLIFYFFLLYRPPSPRPHPSHHSPSRTWGFKVTTSGRVELRPEKSEKLMEGIYGFHKLKN